MRRSHKQLLDFDGIRNAISHSCTQDHNGKRLHSCAFKLNATKPGRMTTGTFFCMENSDTYNRRLSAMSIIDCKSVLDFVATPVVLARIVDKRQRPWMLATNERDFCGGDRWS